VGLFYDQGYFRQHIDANGWQQESYGKADLDLLPFKPAADADGQPLMVRVDTRGGPLHASVLTAQVGRSRLVLLNPAWRRTSKTIGA